MKNNIVVGNWKMNASSLSCHKWITDFNTVSVPVSWVISPPFPYIQTMKQLTKALKMKNSLSFAGQNCHTETKGAYTGEVSAEMLKDLDCQYCIIGHSERRANFSESSNTVKKKALTLQQAGICPIICIGESIETKNNNETQAWITKQLNESCPASGSFWLAYEPIWAIGQGQIPKSDDLAKVISTIRNTCPSAEKVLYGGSVNASNAKELMQPKNIDGFLVGGASLEAKQFLEIGNAILDC